MSLGLLLVLLLFFGNSGLAHFVWTTRKPVRTLPWCFLRLLVCVPPVSLPGVSTARATPLYSTSTPLVSHLGSLFWHKHPGLQAPCITKPH